MARIKPAACDAVTEFCRLAGLPEPDREFRFASGRRFRFDYAWPARRVALEVEGGVYAGGRHTRGRGYERDCEKYNLAVMLGWRVLRYSTGQINAGAFMGDLDDLLRRHRKGG